MSKESDKYLDMYLDFRKTIDTMCFPMIYKEYTTNIQDAFIVIKDGDTPVGFLMMFGDYVDSLYVKPEYRRKGLARKAVVDYLNSGGSIFTLHIVNTNQVAKKFWNSLFKMKVLNETPVDTLYQIIKVKDGVLK